MLHSMVLLKLLLVLATFSIGGKAQNILPQAFEVNQHLSVGGAADVHSGRSMESFQINGEHYLAVANYGDLSCVRDINCARYHVDSMVYHWDPVLDKLALHQRIGTYGAQTFKYFTVDGEHYLAVANKESASSKETPELRKECYARGDWFSKANAHRNGDSALMSSVNACADSCSSTLHCGFFRFNMDTAECEHFHMQAENTLHPVGKSHEISPLVSGTILRNCSMHAPAGTQSSLPVTQGVTKIYKWNAKSGFFMEHQDICTTGATDLETVKISGDLYLAIATHGRVDVYRWSKAGTQHHLMHHSGFVSHQHLTALHVADLEAFQIDGKHYLAVASKCHSEDDHGDGTCESQSIVYRWEDANDVHGGASMSRRDFLIQDHILPVQGAFHIKAFTIDDDSAPGGTVQHLAVANQQSSFEEIGSDIFRWDGKEFKSKQLLRAKGAIAFEAFKMDEYQFLAAASHYDSLSKLFRFDKKTNAFTEFQTFDFSTARTIKAFAINGQEYLVLTRTRKPTVIYSAPLPCSIVNSNQMPGHECMCDDGFEGDIGWLGSSATGECLPAECNIENSNNADGIDCACNDGYEGEIEWVGSTPEGSCLENASAKFPMIVAIPALICISLAVIGIFVYRKCSASYAPFREEQPPEWVQRGLSAPDATSTFSPEPAPAMVIGSPNQDAKQSGSSAGNSNGNPRSTAVDIGDIEVNLNAV